MCATGIFTMPLVLPAVLGKAAGGGTSSLEPLALLVKLVKVVLLPTLLGASARAFIPSIATTVDSNRQATVYISAFCLACVPWMQVSRLFLHAVRLRDKHSPCI